MSPSSAPEADRGQVQPLPALVAVLALTLALGAYADVTTSLPSPTGPDGGPAVPALKRVEAAATTGALLDPTELDPTAAALDGYRVNVTLTTHGSHYAVGPSPRAAAETAETTVAVSLAPTSLAESNRNDRTRASRVVPGTLRVEVWSWTAA